MNFELCRTKWFFNHHTASHAYPVHEELPHIGQLSSLWYFFWRKLLSSSFLLPIKMMLTQVLLAVIFQKHQSLQVVQLFMCRGNWLQAPDKSVLNPRGMHGRRQAWKPSLHYSMTRHSTTRTYPGQLFCGSLTLKCTMIFWSGSLHWSIT